MGGEVRGDMVRGNLVRYIGARALQALSLMLGVLIYLKSVVTGNLGYSFAQAGPVLTVIVTRLGATLLLAGTAWVSALGAHIASALGSS